MKCFTSHFSRFTLHLSLFTFISLAPEPLPSAISPYQPHHRQHYSPEYFRKQRVKDFILIYAWPRKTLLEAWGTAACVVDNAELEDLPHSLVAAVAMVESRFDDSVINRFNCFGAMQVRPFDNSGNDVNLNELIQQGIINCAADLLRPEKNYRAGCYKLAKHLRACGDLPTALSRYSGSTEPINKEYVRRVYDAMQYFEEI